MITKYELIYFLNPEYTLTAILSDINQVILLKNFMAGFQILQNNSITDHTISSTTDVIFLKNNLTKQLTYYLNNLIIPYLLPQPNQPTLTIPQFLFNNGIRYEAYLLKFPNNISVYLFNNVLKTSQENNEISRYLQNYLKYHNESVINMIDVPSDIAINMPCIVSIGPDNISRKIVRVETMTSMISFLNDLKSFI